MTHLQVYIPKMIQTNSKPIFLSALRKCNHLKKSRVFTRDDGMS